MGGSTLGSGFSGALIATGPHPSLGSHADTYGWLTGSWTGEYADRSADDGTLEKGEMEVHFAWVLEGRAMQDVWIAPRISQRRAGKGGGSRDTYGSTLRLFDPAIEAWRVWWLNPVNGVRNDLIGRRVGDEIVQTGWHKNTPIKWIFTRISRESFIWQAYELEADGSTWRLVTEFDLKRR